MWGHNRTGSLFLFLDNRKGNMSVATAALIAHLTSKVAEIANDTARLDCAVWLEEYAVALPASQGSTVSNVQSYSISGRSVTYRNLTELNNRVSELRSMIDAALYGRGGYVDNRLDSDVGNIYA